MCINEVYHLLGNSLGELVHAIRNQRAQGPLTSILREKLFLDVLQECKGNSTTKGVVRHAHVSQPILTYVVE